MIVPEVGFGVVGLGAISVQHIEAIRAVGGSRLAAVMTRSPDKARAIGERAGVPWTTDLNELLAREDVDAVTICSPSGLHPGQALAALRAGKHVLVEKPIALTVRDADEVIAEAVRNGRIVSTVSQRRFEPVVVATREAVRSGALGRMVLIVAEGLYHRPQSYYDSAAWRGTIAMDGGVLMNQGIHLVDLVRWIGGPVTSVAGSVATLGHEMEAEDTAAVSLRFENGSLGSIVMTTCAEPVFDSELRIYGDAGHIRIVGEEAVEWPGNLDVAVSAPSPTAGDATPISDAKTWGTSASTYVPQYADLVGAILDGRPPAVTGEDGRDAVAIITAAYEASRTRRAVEVMRGAPATVGS